MMKEQKQAKTTRHMALALSLLLVVSGPAAAESLFHASANYKADAPLVPRSLFTPPISRNVGDIVTVTIDETAQLDSQAELKLTRDRNINDNGNSVFNSMLKYTLGLMPFNTNRIRENLSVPVMNAVKNQNNLSSKAETTRSSTLKDSITCQVVQVFPNGDLMIQGHKTVAINKEQQDLVLTGVVKPYYLDRFNQVASTRIANMQLMQGGKGVISRQQNDGFTNKIYQFLN